MTNMGKSKNNTFKPCVSVKKEQKTLCSTIHEYTQNHEGIVRFQYFVYCH